jgi:hypothetical protein
MGRSLHRTTRDGGYLPCRCGEKCDDRTAAPGCCGAFALAIGPGLWLKWRAHVSRPASVCPLRQHNEQAL